QVFFLLLQDRHVKDSPASTIDREPEVDPSQDYQLLLGYENSTHTVLRFRRRFDTCDHHDIPITISPQYAVGEGKCPLMHVGLDHFACPISEVGPDVEGRFIPLILIPHSTKEATTTRCGSSGPSTRTSLRAARWVPSPCRNTTRVPAGLNHCTWSSGPIRTPPGPEETARVWELRNPPVDPPSPGETLYWCRVYRIPTISRKHHLIRYEPLQGISGSNGLQHVVLYECQDNPEVEKLADTPGRQCYEPHTQPVSCNTVVASWAKGSEGFSFPPEAGYPLDAQNSRFYLMETHYTTPLDGSHSSLDGSGLRLYYTPELRRHDAGVISIGMDPNWRHIIPPGQQRVISSGHCVSDCTRQAFPHGGINMFAVVMKTHKIGKQVSLKHIRGNAELPPIASDDNIDSDYQEYRKLGAPVRIQPGDHLITQCTYNSSGRSAITLGGMTSREETCLVMGLYYPRQKSLAACHSLPSLPTVLHSLGIQELSPGSNPVRIAAPPELAGMTLESRLVSYDWDNQFQSFQEATMKGSFKPLCWTAQSTLLPNTDKDAHYPNVSRPYVKNIIDQCNYRKYSTEGWPGGTPVQEVDGNHIEGAARSKVSRSSSPAAEESLGLSRFNSASTCATNSLLLAISVLLFWVNR
ncbi:hypothetical protein NQ317_006425, partial [Molorchus minor]